MVFFCGGWGGGWGNWVRKRKRTRLTHLYLFKERRKKERKYLFIVLIVAFLFFVSFRGFLKGIFWLVFMCLFLFFCIGYSYSLCLVGFLN